MQEWQKQFADLLTPCSTFAQLSNFLVSEWKECSKFVENIGSSLLMLEACDDIVEELKDEAEPRSIKKILKWGQRKGPDCY